MAQSHFYLRLNRSSLPDEAEPAIDALFVEACADGFVTREVGVDSAGKVVHRSPTASNPYCLAGSRAIERSCLRNDLPKAAFDALWDD